MKQTLGYVTCLVNDYDEAIEYFTKKLQFELKEDTIINETKRWVRVAPPGAETGLLLAKASTEEQKHNVGNQTGGRVAFFLYTDNFDRDYEKMKLSGIEFTEEPGSEVYGKVIVFKDLYSNKWDFIQPGE
jgi:catechol 2,3-dioxygenase-like lactoylglutathione lyase family enzyme